MYILSTVRDYCKCLLLLDMQLKQGRVFGVKGQLGDMVIAPALMPEQYDQEGKASLKIEFAGRKFSIHIFNREKKEWNKVQIKEAFCDGTLLSAEGGRQARLKRSEIEKLTLEKVHEINIILN